MRSFFARPLFLPFLSFIAGVFSAGMLPHETITFRVPMLIFIQAFFLFLSLSVFRSSRTFYVLIAVFFFFMGITRYVSASGLTPGDIRNFLDEDTRQAVIYGVVASNPLNFSSHRYESISFDLELKKIILEENEMNATGRIKAVIYSPGKKDPRFADRVVMSGKLSLPPKNMNPAGRDFRIMSYKTGVRARFSSSKNDIFGITGSGKDPITAFRRFLSYLRKRSEIKLKKYLSGPALGAAGSVALGIRTGVDGKMRDVLVRTGTMHILAVSGLHVGIAAFIFLSVFRAMRLSGPLSNMLASLGILGFAAFTGCSPSSLRAAVMGCLILLSYSFSRKPDIVNALAVSAFIITFAYPGQLFRPGFILSYAAVISIVVLTPLTSHFLGIGGKQNNGSVIGRAKTYFLTAVSVSSAVFIGGMPVIAAYFNMITPSCVPANIFAVPALFLMVVLSAIVAILPEAPFFNFFAEVSASIMNGVVNVLMRTLGFIASLPGAFIRVAPPGAVFIAGFYGVLAAAVLAFKNRPKRIYLVIVLLFAANLFVWKEVSLVPPKDTRITIFHTGKADASLLEFPDGGVMMIDAGIAGKGTGKDSGRDVIAPYLARRGIRRIDCAVITHPHEDHMGGFPFILDNFKVGALIDAGTRPDRKPPRVFSDILAKVKEKKISRIEVRKGDRIKGFPFADIRVLNPPGGGYYGTANNDSVVLKVVTFRGRRLLFSADAESPALKDILMYGEELGADLMKVPHHGGGLGERAVVEEFLRYADPEYLIVTNERGARMNSALLKVSETSKARILSTGEYGAVTLTDAPEELGVKTFL
ncbi:MAG: ComEC/Rec2 family competence protein [Candidatus Omnitrophota bacterium]